MQRTALFAILAATAAVTILSAQIRMPSPQPNTTLPNPITLPARPATPIAPPPAPVTPAPDPTTATIEGLVWTRTRSPLRGAFIRLIPAGAADKSTLLRADDKGAFSFAKLAPGHYTLTTSCGGYVSDYRMLDLKAGDALTDYLITLGRDDRNTPGDSCQVAP